MNTTPSSASPLSGGSTPASVIAEAKLRTDIEMPDYDACRKTSVTAGCCGEPEGIKDASIRHHGIMDNVLQLIGNTPMVRLDRFAALHGLKCELVAKCEFFNPGGSVKDRIGLRMVDEGLASKIISPGDVVIEATSGNTGIGLALACALRGVNMMVTMPEKMSAEKVNAMKRLGASIVRTPNEAAWNSPESHIGLALKLQKTLPNAYILDQYKNPANLAAHFHGTGSEILAQCDGKVDMVVGGTGTGGTLTGVAHRLKRDRPSCVVVGCDPIGSILAQPPSLNIVEGEAKPYSIEGIGYDFVPAVLDRSIVDKWVKTDDETSYKLARDLIRTEGLLIGGSSGSALQGAVTAARDLVEGQRCVVVLPDSCRNYMSKFMDDGWMDDQGFEQSECERNETWGRTVVGDLALKEPLTVKGDMRISRLIQLMDRESIDQVPVVREDGTIEGVVTAGNLAAAVSSKSVSMSDPSRKVMFTKFKRVSSSALLSEISSMLDRHAFAVVTARQRLAMSDLSTVDREIAVGIVTRIDLLRHLMSQED